MLFWYKKRGGNMIRGLENQMPYLMFVFLILAFSFHGCAHKKSVAPTPKTSKVSSDHNRGSTLFTSHTAQAEHSEFEEDSFDEGLDFFSEDTDEEVMQIADPLSSWNRAMFQFNDKLYFWALKPLAMGYKAVIPTPVRTGIKNFFHNLTMPIRMVSCLLQGKGRAASAELSRFLINSTVGVLGLGDPAKRWPELNTSVEDLGQTLGRYGIGNGFYIVWPFLGPSTLRDSVGMVGEWFLNPVSYVEPNETYLELRAVDTINKTSFKVGDYESLKEAAIDPYIALRNAYIQHRKKQVEE
jgi:phospholipid-binding lipoprotein MlaA